MGNRRRNELRYQSGAISTDELQRAVDDFFINLPNEPDVLKEIEQAGIDVQEVLGVTAPGTLTIQSRGAGLGAEAVVVVMVVREVRAGARRAVFDVWSRIILPRLEQRFGVRPVGPSVPPTNPQ